jgi:hypothetical protein
MKTKWLAWDTRPTIKNLMILVAIFAVMMGGLVYGVKRAIENHVVIINDSGQEIAWVSVEVCGQSFDFHDIPDGGVKSPTFRATGDSGFIVTGSLADGTVFARDDGYVTSAMHGVWAMFTIQDGGRIVFNYDSGHALLLHAPHPTGRPPRQPRVRRPPEERARLPAPSGPY